jgi:hypothetical protein
MSNKKHTNVNRPQKSKRNFAKPTAKAADLAEDPAEYSPELKSGLMAVSNMKPKN